MKVTILNETTKNPITKIGEYAGICWGSDTSDQEKNYKRGLSCLESNHGRVLEYVNIELCIEGVSARCIREYYTHIGGSPTRLQESTRYVDCTNFDYVVPKSVENNQFAETIYKDTMSSIRMAIKSMESVGISREDAAMVLPLCMNTKIVDKRNLRNIIEMSHQRMCKRAFWEYRQLIDMIGFKLSGLSDEWKYIVDNYFKPKCDYLGYCPESNSCGRIPSKETLLEENQRLKGLIKDLEGNLTAFKEDKE